MVFVDFKFAKIVSARRFLGSKRALLRRACALTAALSLGGCEILSNDGPSSQNIQAQAVAYNPAPADKPAFNYVLLDIDSEAVSIFGTPPVSSLFATFGRDKGPAPQIRLGVGDVVQLTVFESQAGGLFIPKEAGVRPGNYVTMPPEIVDRPGTLNVPYAGKIRAVGRTIQELEQEIDRALANRAIEPQAVITLLSRSSSAATLVGAFTTPSKIEVGPNGERVLDMIAKANGVTAPGYETYVTVQRDKRKATVYFDTILANANENIYIKPGDTIYAYREPHRYLAFGAVLTQGQIDFGATKLSLAEAVARASGLDDARADPHETFLYRISPRSLLERAHVDLSKFPESQTSIPVVFRANFRDSASYFAAIRFLIADKDVIYVSNSASFELYKFLTLLNNTTYTMAAVPQNLKASQVALRGLGH
jgi:polysaccharide export outer membrane protein